jgi:hypothetical protein
MFKYCLETLFFRERIDSPANRKKYPNEDYTKWMKPDAVADLVAMWAHGEKRPENGMMVQFDQQEGFVTHTFV